MTTPAPTPGSSAPSSSLPTVRIKGLFVGLLYDFIQQVHIAFPDCKKTIEYLDTVGGMKEWAAMWPRVVTGYHKGMLGYYDAIFQASMCRDPRMRAQLIGPFLDLCAPSRHNGTRNNNDNGDTSNSNLVIDTLRGMDMRTKWNSFEGDQEAQDAILSHVLRLNSLAQLCHQVSRENLKSLEDMIRHAAVTNQTSIPDSRLDAILPPSATPVEKHAFRNTVNTLVNEAYKVEPSHFTL